MENEKVSYLEHDPKEVKPWDAKLNQIEREEMWNEWLLE